VPVPVGLPVLPNNPHLLAHHITFRKSMGLLYASTQMISSGQVLADDPHLAKALKAPSLSIPLPLLGAVAGLAGGVISLAADEQARVMATRYQPRFGDHVAFSSLVHSVASTLCNDTDYQQRLLLNQRRPAATPLENWWKTAFLLAMQ
jgi:hypothetical protein